MDCLVRGILQARILEWVAFPFSRGSSQPRDRTWVSCIAGGFFTSWATGVELPRKLLCVCARTRVCMCVCARAHAHAQWLSHVQLFVTPWTVPHQAPVYGILQARILEQVAMPSSSGSSWTRDQTSVSWSSAVTGGFFTTVPPGKPRNLLYHQFNKDQQAQLA